jgi:hypothetical protein
MCEPSAKKTANFFINVAESHCLSNTDWVVRFGCFRRINASSPRAVGPAANHIQRPWNILSAFQAALGGAIVKRIYVNILSTAGHRTTTIFFYFYCCDGMAVALLKIIS